PDQHMKQQKSQKALKPCWVSVPRLRASVKSPELLRPHVFDLRDRGISTPGGTGDTHRWLPLCSLQYERSGTKAVAGDRTAPDDGERPPKVERSVTLPYVPSSVTGARKLLQDELAGLGLGGERLDAAALVLSELVSNALRHATPLPAPQEDSVGVSWRAEFGPAPGASGWVELSVRDGGSSTMPRVARPSVSGLGGRGLGIVQALAGHWGTEMDADTTTVWAVIEVTGGGPAFDGASAAGKIDGGAADGLCTDTSGDASVVEVPVGVNGDVSVRSVVL